MRIVPVLLGVAACSSPMPYAAPVSVTLEAKSGSVTNSTIAAGREMSTVAGYPFDQFLVDAHNAIGADPSRIEVDAVTIALGTGSRGVTTLGDIFDGEVDVQLQMDNTNDTFPTGSTTVASSTGAGPLDLDVAFDGTTVDANDYSLLVGSHFKVWLRGPATTAFAASGADAKIGTTITFDAIP